MSLKRAFVPRGRLNKDFIPILAATITKHKAAFESISQAEVECMELAALTLKSFFGRARACQPLQR
eukprot:4582093-Amphidinium_carterae.1